MTGPKTGWGVCSACGRCPLEVNPVPLGRLEILNLEIDLTKVRGD
jgi:hypothetical protein